MSEYLGLAQAMIRHHLKTPEERIGRFNREIAAARLEANKHHTEAEHLGILMWEMDAIASRDALIEELGREEWAA